MPLQCSITSCSSTDLNSLRQFCLSLHFVFHFAEIQKCVGWYICIKGCLNYEYCFNTVLLYLFNFFLKLLVYADAFVY